MKPAKPIIITKAGQEARQFTIPAPALTKQQKNQPRPIPETPLIDYGNPRKG